jgi:predicted kinase
VLISLSGLPATGKTTLARAAAKQSGAVHLRIDTIEQAAVDAGAQTHPVGPIGYYVARAQAADHLAQGWTVIADCVNPLGVTRDLWREVARRAGTPLLEVEVVCTDSGVHHERVRTRPHDIPGLPLPTWEQVQAVDYEPWTREHLVVDTSRSTAEEAVRAVLGAAASAARLVEHTARR